MLQLGDAAPNVRSIAADVVIGDETFVQYRLHAPGDARVQFEVSLPENDALLNIDAELAATRKQLVRRIHIEEGATVTVPLADELR